MKSECMAEKLKKIRKELKLNQKEMASKIGISRTTYYLYETKNQPVPGKLIQKIISEFGINSKWLENSKEPMLLKKEVLNLTNDREWLIYAIGELDEDLFLHIKAVVKELYLAQEENKEKGNRK